MLLRITLFACLGGWLFGYDLGLIGPALEAYEEQYGMMGDFAKELVVGAAKVGAVFGTFLGGALMLYYGRQPTVAFSSVFYVVGPAIMAAFSAIWTLALGRLIMGLGIGVSAVVVPAYLGEIAPAKLRGRIVELYELLLCLGMVAAQLFDAAISGVPGDWRIMMGAPILPGAALLLALVLLPESPRWLVVQGRLDEALAVMHRVYTSEKLPGGVQASTAEVEHELLLLWSGVEKERAAQAARRTGRAPAARGKRGGSVWGRATARARHRQFEGMEEQVDAAVGGEDREEFYLEGLEEVELGELRHGDGDGVAGKAGGAKEASPEPDTPAALLPPAHHEHEEQRGAGAAPANGGAAAAAGAARGAGAGAGNGGADVERSPFAAGGGVGGEGGDDGDVLLERSASLYSAQNASGFRGFLSTFGIMMWDVVLVATGPEQRAFWLVVCLAVFNQGMASTAIINYAPELLSQLGVEDTRGSALLTVTISFAKLIGVCGCLLLVDVWGRRPLLLMGSAACAAALALLAMAEWMGSVALLVLFMDLFILAFSLSWAGIYWVLVSEVFSMSAKSPASAAATATLLAAGAAADLSFLTLHSVLGGGAFLLYAGVAAASGVFVAALLPETKGRTLAEVQRMLGNTEAPTTLEAAPSAPVANGSAPSGHSGYSASRRGGAGGLDASAGLAGHGSRGSMHVAATERAPLRLHGRAAAWMRRAGEALLPRSRFATWQPMVEEAAPHGAGSEVTASTGGGGAGGDSPAYVRGAGESPLPASTQRQPAHAGMTDLDL